MSEYPGVIRTSLSYLRETLESTLGLLILFAVLCIPAFVIAGATSSEAAMLAFAGYVGLVVYFGQLDIGGNLQSTGDVTESTTVKRTLTGLMVLYYNAVLVVATALGMGFSEVVGPTAGLVVALLVPHIDGEITRSDYPVSLGGAVLLGVWLLKIILGVFEFVRGAHDTAEWLDAFLSEFEPKNLQNELIVRFERTRSDWF
ncbi:hypothetical protein [Halarchaeum nitratireducens]|uniref:Uncharacterized protein n=1 Tax=Halarchaeum nitratireducens TaxID=489913 RepID=A0A830G7Z8_9EURY|nr:hypothetical protein [Halarchaeum nitratireducens]GGN08061.1 hypothetical protein GCM10009021_04220 [Halarchaeum nitratireducens]